jgi:hypothetical protein
LNKPSDFSVLGFTVSLFVWFMMPCICGRFDAYALLGAGPGVLLAWTGQVRNLSPLFWPRFGLGLITVATSFIFLKVVVDVLWTGHGPLFVQPTWVEHWIYWREM